VDEIKLKGSLLTAGGDGPRYKRVPQTTFTEADLIIFVSSVEWAGTESAGSHEAKWKWFNNDRLVTTVERHYNFYTSPFELFGHITGLSLGKGESRVEFYIDDKLFSQQPFVVE